MTYNEILEMIEQDFDVIIDEPDKAINELYRVSHLSQKYAKVLNQESVKLSRMESAFTRVKKILRAAYWREDKGGIRIYEDDLIGMEDLDFGFDPLHGPDHIPKLIEDRNLCIETNPVYIKYKERVEKQQMLVDTLANIFKYQISRHKADPARTAVEYYKAKL